MPTVPTYQRDVAPTPILRQPITSQASPEDFGAGVARGLGTLAQGLDQAASAQRQVQGLEATAAAHDADTQYAAWLREAAYGQNGILTLSGKTAVDARREFEKAASTQRLNFGAKLTGQAAQIYAGASESRMLSTLDSVAAHTARERKAWIVDSSAARATSFAEDAADAWANPAKAADSIDQGKKELERQGTLLGWGADTLHLKQLQFESAAMGGVLLRQAEADPVGAAQYLFENEDKFTAEDAYRAWGQIQPGLKLAAAAEGSLGTDGSVTFSKRIADLLDTLPKQEATEVRAGAAQVLHQQATAAAEQAKVAEAQHKDEVTLGVVTGKVASEDAILADPMLDMGDKATLIDKLRSEQRSTAGAQAFLSQLGTGTARTLNPYDTADRELANKAFDLAMQSLPADQQTAGTMEFVTTTGTIPDHVIAAVRQGLTSSDGAKVEAAIQLAAQLHDAAPQALDQSADGKAIRDAAAVYAQVVGDEGKTSADAAKRLIDARDPEKVKQADVLKASWAQAIKDKAFSLNDVLGAYDSNGFWPGGTPTAGLTPAQEQAITADYLNLAEAAFTGRAQGDLGVARQMAVAEMKRTYGVSRVSGQDVLVKYPPEAFYPAIGGSQDYIRDLAMKDARALDPAARNVMLVATPETSRDVRAGQPPRYTLMFQKADGTWDMANGLFMVGKDDLAALSDLSTEERSILFEGQRVRNLDYAAKGLPPLGIKALPLLIGELLTRHPMPGDDVRQAALDDVRRRRDAVLGRTDPTNPAALSPDLAQRLAAYQAQHGFGDAGALVPPSSSPPPPTRFVGGKGGTVRVPQ